MTNMTPDFSKHSVKPVAETVRPDPEFVDCDGLERMFGIKRSLAYQLLGDGAIKGVSLRRRGQTRGKRLFNVDSVRAYLASHMTEGGMA